MFEEKLFTSRNSREERDFYDVKLEPLQVVRRISSFRSPFFRELARPRVTLLMFHIW